MSQPAGDRPHIGKLTLRVPGLDEATARDLARLVAARLAEDLPPQAGTPAIDTRLWVQAAGDTSPGQLAQRITDEISRALRRGGPGGPA